MKMVKPSKRRGPAGFLTLLIAGLHASAADAESAARESAAVFSWLEPYNIVWTKLLSLKVTPESRAKDIANFLDRVPATQNGVPQ